MQRARAKSSDVLSYEATEGRFATIFFVANLAVLVLSLGFLAAETIRDIDQIQSNNAYFYLVCVFISCLSIISLRLRPTIFESIILSHVAFLYVGTTLIYGLTHEKWPADWFHYADRSINVVAVYAIAVVLAYLFFRRVAESATFSKYINAEINPERDGLPGFVRFQYILIALGLLGSFLNRAEGGGGAAATLASFTWVGLASHLAVRGRLYPIDATAAVVLSLSFILAVISNARASIFEVFLFFVVAHLFFAKRVITLPLAVIALLSSRAIMLFSDIALAARQYRDAGFDRYIGEIYRLTLTSDTLIALVNPAYTHPAKLLIVRDSTNIGKYTMPLLDGSGSILERFTLLSNMDSIMDLFNPDSVKWDELKNLLYCILPSIGQPKDLILSDRITWDAGVRSVGNVGRPMVLAPGEFFYMGGYGGVLIIAMVTFFVFFVGLRLLRQLCRDKRLADLFALHYLFQTVLTSSAISLCGIVFRSMFLDLAVFGLISYLSGPYYRGVRSRDPARTKKNAKFRSSPGVFPPSSVKPVSPLLLPNTWPGTPT